MELDLPTPVYHPLPGECNHAAMGHTNPKKTLASFKKLAKFGKITFYRNKTQRKSSTNSLK
jgi:hypothetical protein